MDRPRLVLHRPAPPPKHLAPLTQQWWSSVCADYQLEQHHLKILLAGCQAWDSMEAARAAIAEHGMTFNDNHGCPRVRPEVGIEKNSRLAFLRCLRELDLDVSPPVEIGVRPPALRSNRRDY